MEQKIIKMVTSPANNSVHSLCSQATRTSNAFLEETWVHKMALHIMVADTQTQSKITPPQARISECTYRWYSLKSSGGNFFTWKQRKPSCLCPPCLPMCTAPTSCRKKKRTACVVCPCLNPTLGHGLDRYIMKRTHITWWHVPCPRELRVKRE